MKSTSHFAMAHLVYAALQKHGVYLNRIAFVYGNIAPDYTPALLLPTHFSRLCTRMTEKMLTELSETPVCSSGRVGAEYSKQLGLLCHFICDNFCFAHNDDFNTGVRQHIIYEAELDAYMRHNCLKLFDLEGACPLETHDSACALLNHMEQRKRDYLSRGYTPANDLLSAFDACMAAIVGVIALSKRVPAAATSIQLNDCMMAMKSYATGENLVFRMFFYKNRHSNIFFLPQFMPPIGALS